jgi:hypothetical protein
VRPFLHFRPFIFALSARRKGRTGVTIRQKKKAKPRTIPFFLFITYNSTQIPQIANLNETCFQDQSSSKQEFRMPEGTSRTTSQNHSLPKGAGKYLHGKYGARVARGMVKIEARKRNAVRPCLLVRGLQQGRAGVAQMPMPIGGLESLFFHMRVLAESRVGDRYQERLIRMRFTKTNAFRDFRSLFEFI